MACASTSGRRPAIWPAHTGNYPQRVKHPNYMEFLTTTDPVLGASQLGYFLDILIRNSGPARDGWTHGSHAELVLNHGAIWPGTVRPAHINRGTPRQCFANAARLATSSNYLYCEGWATPSDVPLPIEHAWCVDPATNTVVDTTWAAPGGAYAGVVLSDTTLQAVLARTRTFGVLVGDYATGHTILRDGLAVVDPSSFR